MYTKVAISLLFLVLCHAQMDVAAINCNEPQLYDAEDGLQKLKVALGQTFAQMDRIQKDVKELRQLETLAKKGMEEASQVSFIEAHSLQYLSTLKHKFESLNLIQLQNQQIASNVDNIKKQIDSTLQAADPQTRKDCCEMLCTMIGSLILNLLQQEQEYMQPITINFESESKQIRIMRGECDALSSSTNNSDANLSSDLPLTEVEDTANTFVSEKVAATLEQDCGSAQMYKSAYGDTAPIFNTEKTDPNLSEYGYQYWFRFLSRYPTPMYEGKKDPWYFMSRLTSNQQYSDLNKGDRLLAHWQGQATSDGYHFTSNDIKTSNWNFNKGIQYGDIEGTWTFMYFSYSSIAKQAVAFLKYSGKEPIQVNFDILQDQPQYLRLIVGGNDQNRYKAFNGQFSSIALKAGLGAFIANPSDLSKFALVNAPEPAEINTQIVEQVLIPTTKTYLVNQAPDPEITSVPNAAFPSEYSVSGWFKQQQASIPEWNQVFRLYINKGTENRDSRLGDRTLAVWCSPQQGGIYHFTTYTYTDLNANGNANVNKNVPQSQQQLNWHFIFYSYNRALRKAEGYIQYQNSKETVLFESINHFLVPEFYITIGKDRFFSGFNGLIGKFRMNFGRSAAKPYFPTDISVPPAMIQMSQPEATEEIENGEIEVTNLEISRIEEPIIPRLIGQNQGLP